jgi:hypothetical protein
MTEELQEDAIALHRLLVHAGQEVPEVVEEIEHAGYLLAIHDFQQAGHAFHARLAEVQRVVYRLRELMAHAHCGFLVHLAQLAPRADPALALPDVLVEFLLEAGDDVALYEFQRVGVL